MSDEIRTALATIHAKSHLAQAESLKKRLEFRTYMDNSAKEVLWTIYFSHLSAAEVLLDAAETLIQRADNV